MAPRNTDMMHFRLDPATQQRIARAVAEDDRFESQSHLIRIALKYYLNRLEAGALDGEPPDPPTPTASADTRRQRPTPPRQRSTEVAG